MKRAVNIILAVVGILVLGIVMLYIFRNPIVSYTLRKIISSESEQKIILSLEKIEFDPLQGSVSLYQPSLIFTDVYLNDKKVMKVNNLSFEKLGVYDVSVHELLFDKRFIADKVLVFKPAIQFEKIAGAAQDTTRFTPEKLIGLLNTNSTTFSSVKLKINEVEIRFGAIHLQLDTVTEFVPDLIDFTLLLENFETQIASDIPTENRILYSDNVILRVKNINKQLTSGDYLHIDSVSYSSKAERFTTDGFSLIPEWTAGDKKNKTQVSIAQIKLDGFGVSEIRGLEKLHLSAIEISDASIVQYINEENENQGKNESDTIQPKSLPKILKDVVLDSLIINDFTFFNVLNKTDTTITAENIELLIKDIAFDSTLLDNPMKHLQMGEVLLSTDMLRLLEREKGISVTYSDFNYSSVKKQLDINDIQLLSDSVDFKGPQFDVDLDRLQIDGFSVHEFLQKKKQILSLKIKQPIIKIDLRQQIPEKESAPKKKNEYLDLLDFQNFSIENGSVNLSNGDKFNIDLTGVNLLTAGFEFIDQDSLKKIQYDTLRIELGGVEAVVDGGSGKIKTDAVLFDNQNFEISALRANYSRRMDNGKMSGAIDLRKFRVSEINVNELLFNKQFNAASIVLDRPVISGNFPIPDTAKPKDKTTDQSPSGLPINFQIGEFRLQGGRVDVVLQKASDTIHVQSNIDLDFGELVSNDSSFISWLEPSDWEARFSNVAVASGAYDLNTGSISFKPRQSSFSLKTLNIQSKSHPEHHENKFEIERITLPNISLSELDYTLLILQDSIRFGKLFIDHPDLSLKLYKQETEKHTENQSQHFDVNKLLDIVYDTIDLNGLQLNLEKNSDSSHALVSVGNFSIEHLSNKKTGTNLMQEIAFQLEEVSVEDSLNNTFLHLCELEFDPKLMELKIHNIDYSKTNRNQNSTEIPEGNDIDVHLSKIVISGTYVSETLPSRVQFNKLRFSDLALTITGGKKGESRGKKELDFDIHALKKYSGVLSRFAIDTTVFDDVSIHYRTFDGKQEHTIKADSIGLTVNRINVDTNMFDQKNPVLIDNIIIDLKGRTQISKDSLYEMQTGRIHYNFPEHRITVDSFYVIPRYDEAECFRRAKFQKGIINLFAEKIEFNDLHLNELLNDKQLHFGGVDVSGLKFNIVKDKKYVIEPGTYKPMPQDLIRGIDQKILIDSLRVMDSCLSFKLYPEKKTNQPGEIFLDKINATAYNFTNIFNDTDRATLRVLFHANIMGESRMDADFYFPLQDTANPWWFSFKTDKVDFTKLNSMTQHLVGLTILRGKGTVDAPRISGNNFDVTGTMIFRYKKVRLSLYSRKKAETETGIFSSVANFFINDLVLKSNNPKFARKPRVGQIYAERDTQKAIVNFAFKGILSGMLSTLGINKKEQRKERKEYKKEEKQNSWKSF